jgi:hypothetical protein
MLISAYSEVLKIFSETQEFVILKGPLPANNCRYECPPIPHPSGVQNTSKIITMNVLQIVHPNLK